MKYLVTSFSRFRVSALLKIYEEINKYIFGELSTFNAPYKFQRNIIFICLLCCGLYQRASLE
jgi:hypothetical protein